MSLPVAPAVILYFDGVCGLCNRFVDFVLRRDQRGRVCFAPLQGETARARLDPADTTRLDTFVVQVGDSRFRRSAGVVRVLWNLGPVWSLVGSLLWLIPRPLRDLGYRVVAANRYSLFGKKDSCRLPTPDEAARFLP